MISVLTFGHFRQQDVTKNIIVVKLFKLKIFINAWYIPGLMFVFTPDARFVCKRLISDARIQKSLKDQMMYKVEEHWGPKFLKVLPNTAKVIYSWGRKDLVF